MRGGSTDGGVGKQGKRIKHHDSIGRAIERRVCSRMMEMDRDVYEMMKGGVAKTELSDLPATLEVGLPDWSRTGPSQVTSK